ncbi:uncharacterized protein LOC131023545 [Salvia miltiorrhiza]|uniref:uncharacterized protein LOC131023545 n=1 Tax=Salvia miltiorrhiza TaxID=226208 RepID=UPI0025ABDF7F|nr:uncharacterized protein LOC131023545 [Salvia miltiorrhiza]
MATLQKFKFLATQCAVAASPTKSPTTSPVIHLRRRKTLRMLLGRGGRRLPQRCDDASPDRSDEERSPEKSVSHKLKDLFVSSPPSFSERASENAGERLLPAGGGGGRRGGARSLRPLSATFRQRLLRRAWRPALVAIPE